MPNIPNIVLGINIFLLYMPRQWHPTPILLPGKSHGWRSLVGCSPCGHWGWDTTEWLHFHFSLSCIGEGYGNPFQCYSCLENPRDGGAWWAAVYGVSQSRTWLKWLSSSSSRQIPHRNKQLYRLWPIQTHSSEGLVGSWTPTHSNGVPSPSPP